MSMAPSSSPALAHALSRERLHQLERALLRFDAGTRARGLGYVGEKRVLGLDVEPNRVIAQVQGTEPYRVDWSFAAPTGWSCRCSCPVGFNCKHAFAAAQIVIEGARSGGVGPKPGTKRSGGSRVALALDEVRASDREWRRTQGLQVLLQESRAKERQDAWAALREPDPDVRCWLIARAIAEQPGAKLVSVLEPYRDRPDLEQRRAGRARERLAADLLRIATAKRASTERRIRAEIGLSSETKEGLCLTIRARVTSARLRDAYRTTTQLERLHAELSGSADVVRQEEAMLLAWFADNRVGGDDTFRLAGDVAFLPTFLQRFAATGLVRWAEDLDEVAVSHARIAPGTQVRVDPSPAQIRPACTSRDGEPWIHLEVAWRDGRSLDYGEVVHVRADDLRGPRGPGVVLTGGVVSCLTTEPQEELLDRFEVAEGFRVGPDERASLLPVLSEAFAGVAAGVDRHTRRVPCTPVVAVDLRQDDWVQIRVFARAADLGWKPGDDAAKDAAVFEFRPDGGWQRAADPENNEWSPLDEVGRASTDAVSAASSEAVGRLVADYWFDLPDPACVEAVEQWLAALEVRPGTQPAPGGRRPDWEDRDVGWWLRATPRRMATFGSAWDDRPTGAEFFGNPRMHRMLGPNMRVVPKLRIEASGIDWFSLTAQWHSEALALEPSDLAALRAAKTRFVKISSGWVQREAAEHADRSAGLLAELGVEANGEEERLTLWQLAGVPSETLDSLEGEGADPETVEAVRELRRRVEAFRGIPRVKKPSGLNAKLRPYQRDGVDFLAYGADLGLGAILADDMGLGKTLQALTWIAFEIEREPNAGPTLVVCPTSVQSGWAREARRFLPGLDVLIMERGAGRHAHWAEIHERDLVVTNYALLRRDIARWKEVSLRAVIFDEAQNLKNPDAAATRAARSLQVRHRVALTGTPLENRTLDLWSILNVVSPGYLGSRKDFVEDYDGADLPAHRRALLAARLRPVLLRRLKTEVAPDLPDRIEETLDCELTAGQRKLYVAEVARSRALVEELTGSKDGLKKNRIAVLAALTRLRQICCHPALGGGDGTLGSGKIDALFELLEPIVAEGHKVLVFSQFVEYLKIVARELEGRHIPHYLLTGATRDRAKLIDDFSDDPRASVFLLSLKAGGSGLTLTSASYVVLLDPWWNPAVEAQAIDRSHRIGQDRTVIAYRLVARDTIEEKILALQEKKAALIRDILGEEALSARLGADDLAFLLGDVGGSPSDPSSSSDRGRGP